jgi:hypothetical protein
LCASFDSDVEDTDTNLTRIVANYLVFGKRNDWFTTSPRFWPRRGLIYLQNSSAKAWKECFEDICNFEQYLARKGVVVPADDKWFTHVVVGAAVIAVCGLRALFPMRD